MISQIKLNHGPFLTLFLFILFMSAGICNRNSQIEDEPNNENQ